MSWERIKGHDYLVRAFAEVVAKGRLGHAYLFVGPPGVGKRLFAGELAKALLCEVHGRDKLEACGRCSACVLVDAGTHPDLFTASRPEELVELSINTIRELCRDMALKPARGRYKIVILDDADDLSDAAAGCFLKTLEEPPPASLLILIGQTAERQLPTIVSRCQVIHFAGLPESEVAGLLKEQDIDPALIDRLVRLSGGSPGQAQALAEPELWEFRRQLVEGLARFPQDSVNLAKQWTEFIEEAGKEGGPQRRRATLTLRFLVAFLSDLLRQSLGQPARLAEPGDARLLEKLGSRLDAETITELIERSLEADVQIERRLQLVLIIEAFVDAMAQRMGGLSSLGKAH
jgi:DNA polymerase-3 subunit delta'